MLSVDFVIKLFRNNEELFLDSEKCINLTKLEEYVSEDLNISHGTREYSKLESICYKASLVLEKDRW